MENPKKLKRIIYISAGILIAGIIVFVSRGPYISNALKKMILPELENMSGHKVIAQRVYLNVFPLFIEAKGLKVFDENGDRILTAERAKGYIELLGLFRKELLLKRLVIKKPEIFTDKEQIRKIADNVRAYLSKPGRYKIKVNVAAVDVSEGEFLFYDASYDSFFAGKGWSGEILLGKASKIKTHIKELNANIKDFPEIKSEIDAILFLKNDGIDIKNIELNLYGSSVQAEGFFSFDGKAALKTNATIAADSFKKFFKLKKRGDGKISISGDIKLDEGQPFLNLKLKGNFYLQALMELLKVDEKIEGLVGFNGEVKGTPGELAGNADARLKKGSLFGVDIDDLRCGVSYSDGIMSFKGGKGLLYNGHATAEASIEIPDVNYFSLNIDFKDIDSPEVFKLLHVPPEIPKGKITGEFYTSGEKFSPSGWFEYNNKETGDNVLGRIKKIKGIFEGKGNVLSFPEMEARTEKSKLQVNGTVDTAAEDFNLNAAFESADIADITAPYFDRLKGSGDFAGTITGKFGNPLIKGLVKINTFSFDGYSLENISGDVSYRKNILEIKELSAKSKDEHHTVRGSIRFDKAGEIFDFEQPDYQLDVSLRSADVDKLAGLIYKKLPLSGRLDSDFKITGAGPNPEFSGAGTISSAEISRFLLGSVSAVFSYKHKDVAVKKATIKKNGSALAIEGMILDGERFSFKASAGKIYLTDIGVPGMPADAILNIDAEGEGAFDNPVITLNGGLWGGTFKGRPLGKGTINASVKNKNIMLNAVLFNEKMKLQGKAYFDEKLPWTAEIDLLSGRYDFLLSAFLKEIPEDLLLNIKGRADLSGDKKHISASAVINQLNVTLYGYSFSNDSDIKIALEDKKLLFSSFALRSGYASFSLHGSMEIEKEYDLVLEGQSSLSPLKGFSRRISVLRGDADFTLTISGKWDNPQISGSFNVTNGAFGLKDIHQRISSINGYFYFEEDKIIIQRLSGKLGGGDIDVSGLAYLKGFKIRRFYLDAKLNDITTSVLKDFAVNFDGNIIYKGTLESQSFTGEVRLNRARYRERVEWKSWLLKARTREKPKGELTRLEKAVLNIKISGSENIVVDNNIARAPIRLDLVLRGTVGHPLLFGRVETKGGKVYFRNNEFRILNASADFADPNRINPVMVIVAQTIVKGYNIKLSLEGQLEHFNLSLVSEPPLEETDILSLLTVGEVGKELKGLEGGIGASEAAAFLTGKVQDVFEERLKSITGLDRVQVDPYVSKSTGMIGPRVTVSKKLMGDKLFVTYISSVGSTEEQVLKLEYILGKNVSLVGVRNEKGSIGGDITFRFEFK